MKNPTPEPEHRSLSERHDIRIRQLEAKMRDRPAGPHQLMTWYCGGAPAAPDKSEEQSKSK